MAPELSSVIAIGVIVLVCFIVLRFFKFIFSLSFVGFLLAVADYFVANLRTIEFATLPVVAVIAFVLSICGFGKSGVLGKVFAVFGVILSGYLILQKYGIL